jgi:hypothetical protein
MKNVTQIKGFGLKTHHKNTLEISFPLSHFQRMIMESVQEKEQIRVEEIALRNYRGFGKSFYAGQLASFPTKNQKKKKSSFASRLGRYRMVGHNAIMNESETINYNWLTMTPSQHKAVMKIIKNEIEECYE